METSFLQTPVTQFGACAVFAICLYAVFAGSWRERLCGGMYLIAYIAQLCFSFIADRSPVAYTFALDLLCLPIFIVANRKSPNRWFWLAVVAQAGSVATDVVTLLFSSINRWVYLTAEIVTGYTVLLVLLAATLADRRRIRQEKKARASSSISYEN